VNRRRREPVPSSILEASRGASWREGAQETARQIELAATGKGEAEARMEIREKR